MDKRLLSMLNELQYSEEEITRLKKEANESINIDKYYVRNGELLKKITLQNVRRVSSERVARRRRN